VLSIFPNSVDTIKTPGIKKTILLTGSANGRSLITPAIVSFNSVKTEEDVKTFNKPNIPIAVLLEGSFTSLYSNRLGQSYLDSLSTVYNQPFRSNSMSTKMVVISDADIVSNVVTQQEGPLEMGVNQFTQATYANKDFILNTIEYLVNPTGIMETRAKDYTLRLLDPKKLETSRTNWTIINIAVPIVLVIIFGFVFQTLRRKKYNR
jgi:gliding-associated putative ABC transporter substrate-binding component GldG